MNTKFKAYAPVFGVLAIVIVFSIIAYKNFRLGEDIVMPKVMDELIQPYTELIGKGEFEKAYANYTSIDYRRKYTNARYLSAQDSNTTKFGKILDIKPVSGILVSEKSQSKPWIYKGTFAYIGEKDTMRIVIDVTLEDGVFKIYNTYNSYLAISSVTPVIY
ncbi:MAG: hypothetical protein KGZ71_14445 [Desulfobulbaceae bacterium]|nr:hypothetical protein [Candidatus Kapabacteria bacterium]MBS4001673.1 hypothetical protein [Desulfobulbaceae bacterium]